jgi:hypothetical protein
MRSLKLAVVLGSFAVLLVPVLAHAEQQAARIPAPQFRITTAYAKRLVAERATQMHGRHGKGWTVSLNPPRSGQIGGSTLEFRAKVNWGRGIHIMGAGQPQMTPQLAVPEVVGVIDMSKGPGAPKGQKRVSPLAPGQDFRTAQ